MSQCVPRWELDVDPPPPPAALPKSPPTKTTPQQLPPLVPTAGMSERYEVAELTWENGHLSLQGHGLPRVAKPIPKFPSSAAAPWTKHHHGGGGAHGTLEAVVDQATRPQLLEVGPSFDLLPWLGGSHPSPSPAADVLVPCGEAVVGGRKRGRGSAATASQGSAAPGPGESALATFDTSGGGAGGDEVCFTPTPTPTPTTTTTTTTTNNNNSASLGSPGTENTSFGRGGGCYDSVCDSRRPPQDGVCDEEEKAAKRKAGKSSSSAKKSRAAAVHNQSERKRRDRINQRMDTLQKLVPNSSKTDKASMLDEVIEYVKQLQAQVQMMNRMSSMLMPMTMPPPPPPPPPLQMSMIANMANMAQMAQMGMGMGMMDLSLLGMTGPVGLPSLPPFLHPSAFHPFISPSWDGSGDRLMQQPSGPVVPPDPFSAFLACQAAQPMSIDAHNRMAGLYQQLYQQNTQSNSKP